MFTRTVHRLGFALPSTRVVTGPSGAVLAVCALLTSACMDAGGLEEGSESSSTESDSGTESETGEELPDPLGLDECEPFDGGEPAPLPVATWADTADHEVMCALRALDKAVADRSIICLGENGHGISQSALWHALVARYLVHQLGVRTIAVEGSRSTERFWNDYIHSNDPADLEAGFEGVGGSFADSVENEQWIEALADLQAELPAGEELFFTGYDIAVQPQLAREALLEYLEDVAPDEVETWAAALLTFDDEAQGEVDWNAAGDAAAQLHAQLEQEAAAYVAATDSSSHANALVDAGDLRDGYYFLHWYRMGNFEVGNATYREPGMVRNMERLRAEIPADQPILMISHNRHCARDWAIGTNDQGQQTPAVGTHLAEAYAGQYLMIAQSYAGGSYTTRTDGVYETLNFDVGPNMLEGAIGAASEEDALFMGVMPTGSWELWQQSEIVVEEQFDMMLWLREVEGSQIRD